MDDADGPEPTVGVDEDVMPECADGPANYGSSEQDPATIPYVDGRTFPAYLCAYGHGENGNSNPSSGEIQRKDGCDQGDITDAELCTRIEE